MTCLETPRVDRLTETAPLRPSVCVRVCVSFGHPIKDGLLYPKSEERKIMETEIDG